MHYMVEFNLPNPLPETFIALIPEHRAKVNELMITGRIVTYTLAADRQKLWAVVNAENEQEIMDLLAELPLTRWMQFSIHALGFLLTTHASLPKLFLN